MTTARQVMTLLDIYTKLKKAKIEESTLVLQDITDDQLKLLIWGEARVLTALKTEAVRRGIWDSMKKGNPI